MKTWHLRQFKENATVLCGAVPTPGTSFEELMADHFFATKGLWVKCPTCSERADPKAVLEIVTEAATTKAD